MDKYEKQQEKEKQLYDKIHSEDFDSTYSNDPINEVSIDYEAWTEFFSYYRYYIDEFAIDILGVDLFPFQRVILRAMSRGQYSMLIACRGLGKSWIVALFYICISILYPNIKCGIASGNSQQARNVIIQKIKGELSKNETIAREINFPIRTGTDDCYCEFKSGSEIRAITLAQDRGGDSARSWRFNCLLVDEARLVKDEIIETILIPMTKTKRQNALRWKQNEKGKVIFISSAYLKTSGLYRRFKYHFEQMISENKNYIAMCFPYQVGIQAGLFDTEDIEQERAKPTMSADKFSYEYIKKLCSLYKKLYNENSANIKYGLFYIHFNITTEEYLKKAWSEKEVEILTNKYNNTNIKDLCKILGRSKGSIQSKAKRMHICVNNCSKWNNHDIEYLKNHYALDSIDEICRHLNRDYNSIVLKANRLGLKKLKRNNKHMSIYSVDENYFSIIDTPNKAYYLGWAITDGNIVIAKKKLSIQNSIKRYRY